MWQNSKKPWVLVHIPFGGPKWILSRLLKIVRQWNTAALGRRKCGLSTVEAWACWNSELWPWWYLSGLPLRMHSITTASICLLLNPTPLPQHGSFYFIFSYLTLLMSLWLGVSTSIFLLLWCPLLDTLFELLFWAWYFRWPVNSPGSHQSVSWHLSVCYTNEQMGK